MSKFTYQKWNGFGAILWILWILLSLVARPSLLVAQPQAPPTAKEDLAEPLVQVVVGELPIILSAPHGGSLEIPGAKERVGEGLERKPGGFVTARDGGTEELARQLIATIERQFGKKPYAVINRAHRRYMDPNRAPAEAFEDPAAQKIYETYHQALDRFCREVKEKANAGLLIDLHGQGSRRDTVYRGTQNGLTVSLLRQRFGEDAQRGERSLMGWMKERGFTVFPDPLDGKEQSGFLGGFIVKNYGSHERYGIDAVQLEFGGLYRVAANRRGVAEALSDAVAVYAKQYLNVELPAPQGPLRRFVPAAGTEKPPADKSSPEPSSATKPAPEQHLAPETPAPQKTSPEKNSPATPKQEQLKAAATSTATDSTATDPMVGFIGHLAERELIPIWPGLAPGETTSNRGEQLPRMPNENPPATRIHRITTPTLTYFPAAQPTGSAVVICPGGGFARVVVDKEGTEIAEWLNELGISAFVLRYRTKSEQPGDVGWARPLQDLQRALSFVRSRAKDYQINPRQLGVVGFSAGGQLAGRSLLLGKELTYPRVDEVDDVSSRPNFGLLLYPWNLHRDGTGELAEGLTVPADCPPTFLLHTDDDRVTSLSSVAFYLALKRRGIPAELHIHATGGHGYGLRPVADSLVDTWPQTAAHWLRQRGWAQPSSESRQGLGQSPQ